MATNIIDAFIVTFGLDARGYKTGEREVRDGLKRTREDAKKTFDEFETQGAKGGMALRSLANEAAGFLLILAGASSVKSFASNLVGGEAAAGRLSETLGVSTSRLYAWQEAVKQVGGNEGDASGALQRIATAIQSYKLTGTTGMDADLRGLGITNSDIMSKDPSQILLKMAEAGERLGKPEFAARMQRIGIPQSTIYLLEKGRGSLEALLATTEKQAGVTEKSAKAAQIFERGMAVMQTAIKGMVLPPLTSLIEGMNLFITNSKGVADGAFHISDAFRVAGLNIAIAWDRARLWTAQRVGNPGDVKKWSDQLAKDEAAKEAVFNQHSSSGGESSGSGGGSAPRIGAGPRGGAPQTATDSYIQNYLRRSGFTAPQAVGILGGIRGEGGGVNAVNPTSGAFGIGQWLGPRKRALFAKYGSNPSLEQQMAFLVSELKGGDHGGAAVGRQVTADHTLLAYVYKFMRPQGARNERMMDAVRDVNRGRQYINGHGGGGTTHIGTINVHTKATDAHGIARDMRGAIKARGIVPQADGGIAP